MNKNFLSKKSWHTGSMKHMEKVWKAEQRSIAEEKQIALLKREKAEEERLYELRKMADTAAGKTQAEKLDWLYSVKKGPSAEEYLTGAAVKQEEERELEQLSTAPGSLWLQKVNAQQDAFAKVRDDPLLAIKQAEKNALKKILDNPLQMKRIKEKIKKKDKKHKKDKKNKREKDSEHKKESKHRDEDDRRERRERDDEVSGRRDRDEDDRRERDEVHGRDREHYKRDRDEDDRRDRRDRDSKYDRDDRREHKRYRDEDDRRDRRDRDEVNGRRDRDEVNGRDRRDRDEVNGRDREYKRDRYNNNNYSNNRRTEWRKKPAMSEEERKRKLQEMEEDAVKHEELKLKKLKAYAEEEKQEAEDQAKHAKFIDDMNKSVYTEHNDTLEERVKRNIHFIQRNNGTALVHDESGLFS